MGGYALFRPQDRRQRHSPRSAVKGKAAPTAGTTSPRLPEDTVETRRAQEQGEVWVQQRKEAVRVASPRRRARLLRKGKLVDPVPSQVGYRAVLVGPGTAF